MGSQDYSVDQNIDNLIQLTKSFLRTISESTNHLPVPLREILAFMREEADRKFPGHGTTFSGSYLFLRFICPALVFPETSGILARDYEVSKGGRRCLMLVSKALQNLANGVKFREDYMDLMNETFLEENIPVIQEFFGNLSVVP